jgi:hypothetical protein
VEIDPVQIESGPQVPYSSIQVSQTFSKDGVLYEKVDEAGVTKNCNLATGAITNLITGGELVYQTAYRAEPSY